MKKKVLIVDDDADLREIAVSVLSRTYSVSEAGGREEAMRALEKERPDLVILDVMMDTMSTGFDLAREIKRQSVPPKILMLTNVDKETRIDFKSEAGNPDWLPVDDYLTKPVTSRTLLEKVGALLS
jgi:DNA-binding response OmpR family regulator